MTPSRVPSKADDDFRFCRGDSGGAWLFDTGSGYLLFGIHVSSEKEATGSQCANGNGAPQVASRVSAKINWIENVIGHPYMEGTLGGQRYALCTE
jgi:secreted trypsin-like serine protease